MTGRLADISVAIQEWVVTALATQEMATALGVTVAAVGPRIWDAPPPPDALEPFIQVTVTEPRDIGGVGTVEVMAVAEVTVKAVGRAESYEDIRPVAVAIHHALQGRVGVPLNGGGAILSSRRLRAVSYPEQANGVEYRHLGGTYQVHAQ